LHKKNKNYYEFVPLLNKQKKKKKTQKKRKGKVHPRTGCKGPEVE
jgi:hypothetical protein